MRVKIYLMSLLMSGLLLGNFCAYGENRQVSSQEGKEEIAYTSPQNDRYFYNNKSTNTNKNTNTKSSNTYSNNQKQKQEQKREVAYNNDPYNYYPQDTGIGPYRETRPDPATTSFNSPDHHGDWDYRTNWRFHSTDTRAYLRGEDQSIYDSDIYQQHTRPRRRNY